jgi:hypothetical protein
MERDAFWSDIEKLGTPRSRLGGPLSKRKASWVKEGLVARVRHPKGEENSGTRRCSLLGRRRSESQTSRNVILTMSEDVER